MSPAELAKRIAALDWSGASLQHQLAVVAACETLTQLDAPPAPPSNVVPLRAPVRWTRILQLDGLEWASTHSLVGAAWGWIVETVVVEHGCGEEQVGCAESEPDGLYDGDDLVTIDGLPAYRISHKPKAPR